MKRAFAAAKATRKPVGIRHGTAKEAALDTPSVSDPIADEGGKVDVSDQVETGDVVISRELFNFLMGTGPLDGTWFNELNRLPGRYWWRALLRCAERESAK